MLLRLILSVLLILPVPAWAAWIANGNDHIDSANNAVTGIDVGSFSWSCWINLSSIPASSQDFQIITHAALIASGNLRANLAVTQPSGTGVAVFSFYEGFSGQAFSKWTVQTGVANLATSTWYQIGVDYDSVAANDPVLVVNGTSRSITEITTPSGTRLTGADSLRIGEDLGGGTDYNGSLAECGFWNRRLSSGEWTNLGTDNGGLGYYAPSKIPSGLVYYIPLISDTTETQGATGTLTNTGGTFGTHPPNMLYPSSGRRPIAPMLLP